MAIDVMCSRGCGVAIHVDDETLAEFAKLGKPIDVTHDVCPRDVEEDKQPTYRVAIEVYRQVPGGEEVLLSTNGAEVQGPTFKEVFAKLSERIGGQWQQTGRWAEVAETNL